MGSAAHGSHFLELHLSSEFMAGLSDLRIACDFYGFLVWNIFFWGLGFSMAAVQFAPALEARPSAIPCLGAPEAGTHVENA